MPEKKYFLPDGTQIDYLFPTDLEDSCTVFITHVNLSNSPVLNAVKEFADSITKDANINFYSDYSPNEAFYKFSPTISNESSHATKMISFQKAFFEKLSAFVKAQGGKEQTEEEKQKESLSYSRAKAFDSLEVAATILRDHPISSKVEAINKLAELIGIEILVKGGQKDNRHR